MKMNSNKKNIWDLRMTSALFHLITFSLRISVLNLTFPKKLFISSTAVNCVGKLSRRLRQEMVTMRRGGNLFSLGHFQKEPADEDEYKRQTNFWNCHSGVAQFKPDRYRRQQSVLNQWQRSGMKRPRQTWIKKNNNEIEMESENRGRRSKFSRTI